MTSPSLLAPSVPVVVEFVRGTSLVRKVDRPSPLPIVGNGPSGTFVVFPGGFRVSLPTDQIVTAEDAGGRVRAEFWGMAFTGLHEGRLTFHRVRELHPEHRLSPGRSHVMTLETSWVAGVSANGRPHSDHPSRPIDACADVRVPSRRRADPAGSAIHITTELEEAVREY